MKHRIALASALSIVIAAPAVAGPGEAAAKPARQCFYAGNVNGFRALDEHVMNVRVGVREVWQFEMFGACPDLDRNERIALVSRNTSWICSGLDADIVTHSPIGRQRCPVRNVRKLTPAEIAALPKRALP